MAKVTISELEAKQGTVEEFNGKSHEYTSSIRVLIQNLKETNEVILKEIKETEALVAAYNANISNLQDIMIENSRIINEVSKVFQGGE